MYCESANPHSLVIVMIKEGPVSSVDLEMGVSVSPEEGYLLMEGYKGRFLVEKFSRPQIALCLLKWKLPI